ncbi:hypothetical protein BX666DRAFT_200839 [Dichotomocladium elegans]|nr:hypothetical protein BX666DRAFT_200839 [Dichotomocladium elegans]
MTNSNIKATPISSQRKIPPSMHTPAPMKAVPKLPRHGHSPAENALKQQQQMYSNKNRHLTSSKCSPSAKSAITDVQQQHSSNKNKKPSLAKTSSSVKPANALKSQRQCNKNKNQLKTAPFAQVSLAAEQQKLAVITPEQERSANMTNSKKEWGTLKKENHHPKLPQQGKRRNNNKSFPVMAPKARRAELKREIASMTDALQSFELSSSPPSSSGESSDSETPNGNNRSFPRNSTKQQNQTGKNAAMASKLGSNAVFPVLVKKAQPDQKATAAKVYCGPRFSNAPAPSALPLPGLNSTPSHAHPIAALAHDDGVFAMDDLQQQSKELMNLLVPQNNQHASLVPFTPRTAHTPGTVDSTLSEIQRGLRSMLKIST